MLLKLLPDQVAKYWHDVSLAIERSLPPVVGEHPDKMNRILERLLTGEMQCWAAYRKNEEIQFIGFVVTTVTTDYCSMTRNLLLYCICGFEKTNLQDWKEGYIALVKYGHAMQCNRIVAYTKQENLINLAKRMGGEVDYRFISVPLDGSV